MLVSGLKPPKKRLNPAVAGSNFTTVPASLCGAASYLHGHTPPCERQACVPHPNLALERQRRRLTSAPSPTRHTRHALAVHNAGRKRSARLQKNTSLLSARLSFLLSPLTERRPTMRRLTQAARLLALLALWKVLADGFSVGDILKPFVRRRRAPPPPPFSALLTSLLHTPNLITL